MYNAIVCKIENTQPIPGADRIKQGFAMGNSVVVSTAVADGTLGVYFPTDGQLSMEFCELNNLYPIKNANGKKIGGGFFEPKNRRVKTQKFMGIVSDGFWCDLSLFDHEVYAVIENTFIEGVQFNELNGRVICNKYITQATRQAGTNGVKTSRTLREHPMMPMHFDTKQLRYELPTLRIGQNVMVYFLEKLHGTSGRLAYVLEERPLTGRLERFAKWLGVKVDTTTWQNLMGTRRVLIGASSGQGFYGDDNFRFVAAEKLIGNLHKGEAVYFEIVGWANNGQPIMNSVSTKALSDKGFTEKYGEVMQYKYGVQPGTAVIYVYRITQSTEDGGKIELTWSQVKRRCTELGVAHVPELAVQFGYTVEGVLATAAELAVGESTLDHSHIREGVCVRFESETGEMVILKHKSDEFKILEGFGKREDVVDIEEAADLAE